MEKDHGLEVTEETLKKVEKRIEEEYEQAIEEIELELYDYLKRFETKDKTWQKWVENGTKTKEEYQQWRMGQMAVGKQWSNKKDSIARELVKVNEKAKETYKSSAPEIYAENANAATYEIEHQAKINTSFELYSKDTVERLVKKDPEVLPGVGKKVAKQIAEGKAVKWNRQQLQSVMVQGILQGDSIPKLATRLANKVGDSNRKAAIRNARTMATAAQNAGRVDSYKKAQEKGVDLEQMWLATMDNRTRHTHRWLDHETRPVGEAFSNGCEYPGDPKGDPAEIYNCRCSLRGVVKGLDRRSGKYRDDSAVGGMSYEQWKNARAKSNPIDLPEKKANAIRRKYLDEYMRNGIIGNNVRDGIITRSGAEIKALTDQSIIDNLMWVDVNPLKAPLTDNQIIEKLGAEDPTQGSCASQAWAYLANKVGLDVKDYRGGDSEEIFANRGLFMGFLADNDIKHYADRSTNDIKSAQKLLKNMESGKEYLLRTGSHAAIVRRSENGYEYLELQTDGDNGFKTLDKDELKYRFKCRGMHLFDGENKEKTSILVDADSMAQSEAFSNLLGYINTVIG